MSFPAPNPDAAAGVGTSRWPAALTVRRMLLFCCGLVFLHFLATVPNSDANGNFAVARMVEGRRFFGNLWDWGWMHRPVGYRFSTFLVVRAVEAMLPTYRSVGGQFVGNAVVVVFAIALAWTTSGATTWLRLGRLRLPAPALEVWLALTGVFAVGYRIGHQPCHYAAVFALGAFYCWRRQSLLWHPLGAALFALAFAQKYVSGVYLPTILAALILIEGKSYRQMISPVLWASVGSLAVLGLLFAHPHELKDAVTGTLIQRAVWDDWAVTWSGRLRGMFSVGPILPEIIPTTVPALAVLPALLPRLARHERWMLAVAWVASFVPLLSQETGFEYHLTPTLGPALLTLGVAMRRSVGWTKDCLTCLVLICGYFAAGAWFSKATEGANTIPEVALLLSAAIVWVASRMNELRQVVVTVVLLTCSEWALHDFGEYKRDAKAYLAVSDVIEQQKLEGPGLYLVPASGAWVFSDLHSACRHTSAIPLQRLAKALPDMAVEMAKDPGVRENLDCVARYDGNWILVHSEWFGHRESLAPFLPRDPLQGYKRAAKVADIEVWTKNPIKVKTGW